MLRVQGISMPMGQYNGVKALPQPRLFQPLERTAAVKLPAIAELLFKGYETEPSPAPSTMAEYGLPSGKKINLRHWTPPADAGFAPLPAKTGPVVLFVHGLGGTTDWMSSMATKILSQQSDVVGLELDEIGIHPSGVGDFADRQEIISEIAETVEWLSQKEGRPVFVIGLSLGGLLVSHAAAKQPKGLGGIAVISPAYKAATATFKPYFYVQALFRRIGEKLHIVQPKKTLPIPFAEDQTTITRNPEKIKLMDNTPNRVLKLTPQACVQLIQLTLVDTPKVMKKITCPVALYVAQDDKICDAPTMLETFGQFASKSKQLIVFPEGRHDLTLEAEMPAMANHVNQWIAMHSDAKAPAPAKPEPADKQTTPTG